VAKGSTQSVHHWRRQSVPLLTIADARGPLRSQVRRPSPASSEMTSEMKQPPPFDWIALLFQGVHALGAYQAGDYEAPADADIHPDWTAGITIGAINGALIAGNAPHQITKTSSPSSFSTTAANRTN
jgi:hypothetical protein